MRLESLIATWNQGSAGCLWWWGQPTRHAPGTSRLAYQSIGSHECVVHANYLFASAASLHPSHSWRRLALLRYAHAQALPKELQSLLTAAPPPHHRWYHLTAAAQARLQARALALALQRCSHHQRAARSVRPHVTPCLCHFCHSMPLNQLAAPVAG